MILESKTTASGLKNKVAELRGATETAVETINPPVKKGRKFVQVPIEEYERMVGIIEDYGLYLAMLEVKDEPNLSLEEALEFMKEDEN